MTTPEFRVRPVIRHVVTRYSTDDRGASLETLGEFNHEEYADIVAEALRERAAPREYVIVRQKLGEIAADVMYAYSEAEVEVRLAEMATPDAPPCHVYSRPRNMTVPG
jgi:HEAT repeat protein